MKTLFVIIGIGDFVRFVMATIGGLKKDGQGVINLH